MLEKHKIFEPTLAEELDKLKTSDSSEMALSGLIERLICNFEWKDGHLEIKCTRDL